LPLHIKQKLPRCFLCGRTIPPKKKKLIEKFSKNKDSKQFFCSEWCQKYYLKNMDKSKDTE
jgi:predicted nucleic acid-binding Zn ribbon protein